MVKNIINSHSMECESKLFVTNHVPYLWDLLNSLPVLKKALLIYIYIYTLNLYVVKSVKNGEMSYELRKFEAGSDEHKFAMLIIFALEHKI